MNIPFDLFSDIGPSESQEKTSFFASEDMFSDIEPESDADLFDDIEESDEDLFGEIEDSDEDLFGEIENSDEDIYDVILGSEQAEDTNPNTSVLYAVPGVNYGRPEDFPDITQIKERFLSELMSDL